MNSTEVEKKSKEAVNDAFGKWLSKPESKLLLSMIPPSPNSPDLVVTFLKVAFEQGFDTGAGFIAQKMVLAMLEHKTKEG